MGAMRVVAGSARGRKLIAPSGHAVRPTADRVRQATFNALESRGLVEGARVIDLFAGTGALGIEALSRGAEAVTFVDESRESVDTIRTNINNLGFVERATIIRSDVLRWAMTTTPATEFDLVFADPPYTFEQWPVLLDRLRDRGAVLVAESRDGVDAMTGWEILRQQRYGGTVVTVLGTVAHHEEEQT